LRKLKLECLHLLELPEAIGSLTRLEQLHLYTPKVTKLPAGLGRLASLKSLSIHGSPHLTALPEGARELTSLETVVLDAGIEALPESLRSLPNLRTLRGSFNVAEGIGSLSTLEHLAVTIRALESASGELGALTKLRTLTVRANGGDDARLPAELGMLSALVELGISGLGLSELPGTLCQLHHLEKLDASRNKLKTLEWLVRALPRLSRVNFAANKITRNERSVIDQLLRLPPAERASAEVAPTTKKAVDLALLGKVTGINASVTVVLCDASLATRWIGVGDDEIEDATDWDRLHKALFPTERPKDWRMSARLPLGEGTALGLALWDEGSGFVYVFRTPEGLVLVEGEWSSPKDDLFLEWVSSPPGARARDAGTMTITTKMMAALDSTEHGRNVVKALKRPPQQGKAKGFGEETKSLLFHMPNGTYRAWVEDKVSQSWGRACRCIVLAQP
jgi:hypothetical protein